MSIRFLAATYRGSITIVLAVICCCAVALYGQKGKGSSAKKNQLEKVRQSIRRSQSQIEKLRQQEKRSAEAASRQRQQIAQLDTAILGLQSEEERLAMEMIRVRATRDSLNDEMAILTEEYIRVARALYKQRLLTPAASILLMPEEHRELALKERLFERYVRRQNERAGRIASMHTELTKQDALLALRQQQHQELITGKQRQIRQAATEQERQLHLATKARTEQSTLQKYIARKSDEARRIGDMIAQLAAAEKQKLEAERRRKAQAEEARRRLELRREKERQAAIARQEKKTTRQSTTKSVPKSEPKPVAARVETPPKPVAEAEPPKRARRSGPLKFQWPTSSHTIAEGYGERTNPHTNTVTVNPGINIAAQAGSAVRASEDGVVSLVSWLPGYGTIVIVEHRDGYRTVYANLSSASVSRGAEIAPGQKVGTVAESIEGEFLHFEVWKEQTRLNPLNVLQ